MGRLYDGSTVRLYDGSNTGVRHYQERMQNPISTITPVVHSAISLRTCYAIFGTDTPHNTTRQASQSLETTCSGPPASLQGSRRAAATVANPRP
eukprot:2672996-Rhodomonas_salina.1